MTTNGCERERERRNYHDFQIFFSALNSFRIFQKRVVQTFMFFFYMQLLTKNPIAYKFIFWRRGKNHARSRLCSTYPMDIGQMHFDFNISLSAGCKRAYSLSGQYPLITAYFHEHEHADWDVIRFSSWNHIRNYLMSSICCVQDSAKDSMNSNFKEFFLASTMTFLPFQSSNQEYEIGWEFGSS